MLNANDIIKNMEKQLSEPEQLQDPQQIVQEHIPQESLVEKPAEVVEEDELPEEPPHGNLAWQNMRRANKAAKDKLKAETEAREQLEKQLNELKERQARLEGREEARAKPIVQEVQEEPEPDRMLYPDAWKDWKIAQQDKRQTELDAKLEQISAMSAIEGTRRGMNNIEKAYKANSGVSDYDDRMNYIMESEKARIKLLHPNATDGQIDSHLEAEKFRMANQAIADGRNPAELFYKMADTYGYKTKEAKPSNESPKPDIQALNRNMEKNVNLIGSSGAEKSGGVSPNQLFNSTINELVGKQKDIEKLIKRYSTEQ